MPGIPNKNYVSGDSRSISSAVNLLGTITQGDTGFRNITSNLDPSWAADTLLLWRTGYECGLRALNLRSISGTEGEWVNILPSTAIPAGFRPDINDDVTRAVTLNGVSKLVRATVGWAGVFSMARQTLPSQGVEFRWRTSANFPDSSLWPGFAV